MNGRHLTDEEVQQYALGELIIDLTANSHPQQCKFCKEKIDQYGLVLEGIKMQTPPVFDFNLEQAVMDKIIPVTKRSTSSRPIFFLAASLVAFMVPLLFFSSGFQFVKVFKGIGPWVMGLAILTVVNLSGLIIFDMYRNYKAQIKQLGFS